MSPSSRPSSAPAIHKFGGASLRDARALTAALSIVESADRPAVVVVSAFAGVTDALIGIAGDLSRGNDAAVRRTASDLRRRYETSAGEVSRPGEDRQRLRARVRATFEEIAALTAAPGMLRELSPRSIDHLLASGEELSARIFAAGLARRGVRAEYVNAVELIVTDGRPGQASPDLPATDRQARARLRPLLAKGVVPVVPGFLGADNEGRVVTLGRGGSDLTATLLGRALSAKSVTLWKDVRGFLTADPRVVPDARVIPQLNVREAAELAYYGAKVLHPRALTPAGRFRIFVRPFDNPAEAGTEISGRRTLDRYPVKALSAIPGQALVTVTAGGPGVGTMAVAGARTASVSAPTAPTPTITRPTAMTSAPIRCRRSTREPPFSRPAPAARAIWRHDTVSGAGTRPDEPPLVSSARRGPPRPTASGGPRSGVAQW